MTITGGARSRAETVDLLIVGAGIVGLAHAVEAVSRGLSVAVVERDERAVGASVRNFGHGCVTAQDGDALRYALASRAIWARLAKEAGFWFSEAGAVVLAQADDEMAVLSEFRDLRGDDVVLLDAASVRQRAPAPTGVLGGAWLSLDIRVDPRRAVAAIADWLAEQGVRFHFRCSAHTISPGLVETSSGPLTARRIVVSVGHDVDRHFPDLADAHGLRRCALHMLSVAGPGRRVEPAVLTGFSLLRYDGFATSPSLGAVRDRLGRTAPELIDAGLNLMYTQRPDGDLTIGDTHEYAITPGPFQSERFDELILGEIAALIGASRPLVVRQRWQGVYASAPTPFLVAAPWPELRVVSVTSGIGMTTALGLGAEVVAELAS